LLGLRDRYETRFKALSPACRCRRASTAATFAWY
jgi:hypothetical protein